MKKSFVFDNNFSIFGNDFFEPIVYMFNEHYKFDNTWINVNMESTYGGGLKRGIFYDLEHKYPDTLLLNTKKWDEYFLYMIKNYDYILCFQIENYKFYKENNLGDKFRFVPLRYTTYFNKFDIISYENRPFDLQFECFLDTEIRQRFFNNISKKCNINGTELSFILTQTYGIPINEKYKIKSLAKYGIDFPHYNHPETINTFRIWEYACLNMPVILIDEYNVGTKKYFEKNITKTLGIDFNPQDIKDVCKTYHDYSGDNIFKKLTYNNDDYDNYRQSIIKDFCDITQTNIPDSVLLNDWHD